MVCALHSNWQLCGKDALLFVLGNINSQPEKKRGATGTWWADLDIQVTQKHMRPFRTRGKRSPGMAGMDEQVTSLDLIGMFCYCSCQTAELLPLLLSQEANQLSSINQTQSIDSYLVNRSANELGFDRYVVLKTLN